MEQLVQNIREQVRRSQQFLSSPAIATPAINSGNDSQRLAAIDNEIAELSNQIGKGEPQPPSLGIKGRIGAIVKGQLYRFLWWQSQQMKALVDLVLRRGREGTVLFERLGASVKRLEDVLLDCRRQIENIDLRIQQLESAQLKLQRGEIERNLQLATVENAIEGLKTPDFSVLDQRFNELAQRIDSDQGLQNQHFSVLDQRLRDLCQQIDSDQGPSGNELQDGMQEFERRLQNLEQGLQNEAGAREQLHTLVSELGIYTHQTRTTLSLHDRRLSMFIEEARNRLPESLTYEQVGKIVREHGNHEYDSVYRAFEDVFRGSREEIKARQSIYIPLVKERGAGSEQMPVLDVGCGRGEWLELLRDNGMTARGVDRDTMMVDACRALHLSVTESEALAHLKSLPGASIGALTSFHMVEHLPFEQILELIDEALRVLKPGGLMVLETPNPSNFSVGAHTFWLDPTHRKPLPSPMLRFFVEARGFCDAIVRELHPYPRTILFPDDGKGVTNRLNDLLYGPQDYAVIARKSRLL